jgi:catechol 2,3-dioxygenase
LARRLFRRLRDAEEASMRITALGHVVVKVTDQARAEAFYNGVLGLPICARSQDGAKMTFFSLGNHHDFAVMEVSGEGAKAGDAGAGLHHVAFRIGTRLEELREAKAKLDAAGVASTPIDHEVTNSLYLADPDGNGVELYVDVSDAWRSDPQRVTKIAPLDLRESAA